jgi:ATP-dependent Clp protease ATP-binding subunit ClpB
MTGFDPVYGARPLRRLIQTTIEDKLAGEVLAGRVSEGETVTFDVDDNADGLVIAGAAEPAAA